MKLRILPPDGADVKYSYRHLKHLVRVKTKEASLSSTRLGHLVVTGPVNDLVMLKFVLPRFGYRLA